MPYPLDANWDAIRRVVTRAQRSSRYCAIATQGTDGFPNITPVGTLFLADHPSGFFFDRYSTSFRARAEADSTPVCVSAVDTSGARWLASLVLGRFIAAPGVRLYGVAGPLREASPQEREQVEARVGLARWTRGAQSIWSDFTQVRDLSFTAFRPVMYPTMMQGHWVEEPDPDHH